MFRLLKVSLLTAMVLTLSGCGWKEAAQETRDYFQLFADGNYEEAYEVTSLPFRDTYTYEEFEAFVTEQRLYEYEGFESYSYHVNADSDGTFRTLIGDMTFSDGEVAPIKVEWFKEEDGVYRIIGFEFYPED